MDKDFWHNRWKQDQIGFHQPVVNPYLIKHLPQLQLAKHARIFVPLSGKTLDIDWLINQGFHVCAVELSQIAIEQLFIRLNLVYTVSQAGKLQHYQAENIDVYVGDIFDLNKSILGSIDAVYDRAALVALPSTLRPSYVQHIINLANRAPQILIHYSYDQSLFAGPPFSIQNTELMELYQSYPSRELLEDDRLIKDGLNQHMLASAVMYEKVWLLR